MSKKDKFIKEYWVLEDIQSLFETGDGYLELKLIQSFVNGNYVEYETKVNCDDDKTKIYCFLISSVKLPVFGWIYK